MIKKGLIDENTPEPEPANDQTKKAATDASKDENLTTRLGDAAANAMKDPPASDGRKS